ncbi:MAG TPA: hypothetical protein VG603_09125 [Chitinophagales bacterium]|nr:hypothetical protein [Chitinophagales bacterium]
MPEKKSNYFLKTEKNITGWKIGGVYYLLAAALLIKYPLQSAFPGQSDVILYLAEFNYFINNLSCWLLHHPNGLIMYPKGGMPLLGEPSYGSAIIYLLYKLMSLPDLWAYYFFLVTVFTLNSWSLYLLTLRVTNNNSAGFISGLLLNFSCFIYANIDNQNALVFFPTLLSLSFFLQYFITRNGKYFYSAAILMALQIYFSSYFFVFGLIAYTVIFLWNLNQLHQAIKEIKTILPAMLLAMAIAAPFVWFYLLHSYIPNIYSVFCDLRALKTLSLSSSDFTKPLPGNLLYGSNKDAGTWIELHHAAFMGFAYYIFAAIGFISFKKQKWLLLILCITGILIALGPYIELKGRDMLLPLGYLYAKWPLFYKLKHLSRAFFITLIPLTMFAGYGISKLYGLLPKVAFKNTFLVMSIIVVAIENTPANLPVITRQFLLPPEGYLNYTQKQHNSVILNLPSAMPMFPQYPAETANGIKNEYRYMYWQTLNKQNTVNGANGFLSEDRIISDSLIAGLTSDSVLFELQRRTGFTHVIYLKHIQGDENIRLYLTKTRLLIKQMETGDFIIYAQNACTK